MIHENLTHENFNSIFETAFAKNYPCKKHPLYGITVHGFCTHRSARALHRMYIVHTPPPIVSQPVSHIYMYVPVYLVHFQRNGKVPPPHMVVASPGKYNPEDETFETPDDISREKLLPKGFEFCRCEEYHLGNFLH